MQVDWDIRIGLGVFNLTVSGAWRDGNAGSTAQAVVGMLDRKYRALYGLRRAEASGPSGGVAHESADRRRALLRDEARFAPSQYRLLAMMQKPVAANETNRSRRERQVT